MAYQAKFSGLQRSQSRKYSSVGDSTVRSGKPCSSSAYQLFRWVQAWIRTQKEEKARIRCEQCEHFGGYYKGKVTCELVEREVHSCVLKKEVIE